VPVFELTPINSLSLSQRANGYPSKRLWTYTRWPP